MVSTRCTGFPHTLVNQYPMVGIPALSRYALSLNHSFHFIKSTTLPFQDDGALGVELVGIFVVDGLLDNKLESTGLPSSHTTSNHPAPFER